MTCAASTEDLEASIEAAAEAQPMWAALTVGTRAVVLERWASALERNASTIAQLITAENVCLLKIMVYDARLRNGMLITVVA